MELGLDGKVALVCASSQGLGFAVAEELASQGTTIILNARHDDTLQDACSRVREGNAVRVFGIPGDLSKADDVERIVAGGIERFGRIDILVTNVGGPPAGTFESLSREQWRQATDLLLSSVLDLTRLVLPGMKERGWGRILNITSIASKQPVANLMLSNALRAGIAGFSKTLASEVAPFGVTVNNILPGYTRTERLEELIEFLSEKEGISSDEVRNRWETEIPMKRLGEPAEFAALAAFLVSERASYITGTSVAVDGGWTRSIF